MSSSCARGGSPDKCQSGLPPLPQDTFAVVVVAHDSAATLSACIERVLAAEGVAELAIVDNASRDGSVAAVQFRHASDARLRVLRNDANPGFATACNQGAAATSAPWLAFVNPDCFLEPDSLARLRDAVAREAAPGVVGADVVGRDGEREPAARRREPSLARSLRSIAGLERAIHAAPAPDANGLTEVDAVSGALMLVPRAAFVHLGGFDEGYRLHCEDLDLCRRARDAGLRVLVAEDVRVVHEKGGSSRRRPLFVAWHKHRGMWRYWRKFEGAGAPWWRRAVVGSGIALHGAWSALRVLPSLVSRRRP